MRAQLWARAYAKCGLKIDVGRRPLDRQVDVRITITAGPKVKLGRVRITQNEPKRR